MENILDSIPSARNINSMNNFISTKTEYIKNILISIDEWEKELKQKIENLKRKLKKEIVIFKKMFLNHNQKFMNYTYHYNYKNFVNNINNANNEYLKKFYESISFEEKTKNICELFCTNKKELKQINKCSKILLRNSGYNKYAKINEKYFCVYSKGNEKFEILWYENDEIDKEGLYDRNTLEIDFKEGIHSMSFSLDKTKIYVCLSNEKK